MLGGCWGQVVEAAFFLSGWETAQISHYKDLSCSYCPDAARIHFSTLKGVYYLNVSVIPGCTPGISHLSLEEERRERDGKGSRAALRGSQPQHSSVI